MSKINELLRTRALVEPGKYALIPTSGRLPNSIPNLDKCVATVLSTPEIGCKFAFYTIDVEPGGGTTYDFQEEGIQTFVYCISGEGEVIVNGEKHNIFSGGYVFAPESVAVGLKNNSDVEWRLLLYKQRYRPLKDYSAHVVVNNINNVDERYAIEKDDMYVRDLLPNDLGFDVNFHTLSFEAGAAHRLIETHMQQHGIYFLEGNGVYLLEDKWVPVEQDDYLWYGAYTPQAFYATGKGRTTYVYSKDCNRDVEL